MHHFSVFLSVDQDVSLIAFCLQNDIIFYSILKQEDLIQCTDPDTLQVSTKDMDSTLSRASRAIKKTSKKVGGGNSAVDVVCIVCTQTHNVTFE